MNGATAVAPSISRALIRTSTTTIGMSHHFLLCRMNCTRSLKKPGFCSNSDCGMGFTPADMQTDLKSLFTTEARRKARARISALIFMVGCDRQVMLSDARDWMHHKNTKLHRVFRTDDSTLPYRPALCARPTPEVRRAAATRADPSLAGAMRCRSARTAARTGRSAARG